MERKENGREETEFQRQMPDLNGSNETNLMTQLIDHNCISESEENSIKLRANGVMRKCREEVNRNLIDLHKGLTETTRDKVKTKEKIEWLTESILFALVHMKNDNFVKSLVEWAKKKYDERVLEALEETLEDIKRKSVCGKKKEFEKLNLKVKKKSIKKAKQSRELYCKRSKRGRRGDSLNKNINLVKQRKTNKANKAKKGKYITESYPFFKESVLELNETVLDECLSILYAKEEQLRKKDGVVVSGIFRPIRGRKWIGPIAKPFSFKKKKSNTKESHKDPVVTEIQQIVKQGMEEELSQRSTSLPRTVRQIDISGFKLLC